MKLTINQINDVTNGAVYITEQNGGVEFHRFTAEAENLYKNTKDYGLLLAPAGIKLCFETDSTTLVLKGITYQISEVRSFYAIDIIKNGALIDSIKNYDDELKRIEHYSDRQCPLGEFQKKFFLGEGAKKLEIHLPYSVRLTLTDVELDDGCKTEPVKYKRKLFAYGDSITHGFDALHPSERYTARLCDALGVEECNKGIGGAKFVPKLVEIPEENEPSCITVAYGVNDYCCDKKITIQNNCHKFLYNLTKNYPNSQIFVISPIWKNNGVENHDFSDFTDMCMLIGKEVEGFKNVRHICAYDFVPHNPKYYADKAVVHPNADGFEFYFKALYNELRKYNVYNHI